PVEPRGRVVPPARRWRAAWAQPLPSLPHQLFGAADQRLVAVDAPKLLTAAADQPAASRPIPTGGDVAATRWGDLLAVSSDSGVLLMDPLGRREPAFVALSDHPRELAFPRSRPTGRCWCVRETTSWPIAPIHSSRRGG